MFDDTAPMLQFAGSALRDGARMLTAPGMMLNRSGPMSVVTVLASCRVSLLSLV